MPKPTKDEMIRLCDIDETYNFYFQARSRKEKFNNPSMYKKLRELHIISEKLKKLSKYSIKKDIKTRVKKKLCCAH